MHTGTLCLCAEACRNQSASYLQILGWSCHFNQCPHCVWQFHCSRSSGSSVATLCVHTLAAVLNLVHTLSFFFLFRSTQKADQKKNRGHFTNFAILGQQISPTVLLCSDWGIPPPSSTRTHQLAVIGCECWSDADWFYSMLIRQKSVMTLL